MRKTLLLGLLVISFGLNAQDDQVDFVSDQAQNQEIFVHHDKPFYASGETIWFSIYNFRADNHQLIFGRRFMELAIVDRNKQVIAKERIRVVDGKSFGQIAIPSYTSTGNYLLLITYPFEDANNFLYREVLSIFNPSDEQFFTEPSGDKVLDSASPLGSLEAVKSATSYIDIRLDKTNFDRREPITISLGIKDKITGKASIVVRQKNMSSQRELDIRAIALDPSDANVKNSLNEVELMNFRENKKLDWRIVDSHGLLLYELVQKDSVVESSIPYLYIPEDRMTHSIFEVRPGQFVFDATDVSGDEKSLYFTSFSFGTLGAESNGVVNFDWVRRRANYNNILPKALTRLPEFTSYASDYLIKANLRKTIFNAYGTNLNQQSENANDVTGLMFRTAIWKKADDYSEMRSLSEFLSEIVLGLKVWHRRGKYDLRLNFVGGRFPFAPFLLVNGVPTWDVQRVMEIPMKDIFGVGVIKDLQTETGQARDARAELDKFGYYGSNGILSIELRPQVVNPFQGEFNNLLKRQFYLASEPYKTPNYTQETLKSYKPDFRPVLYWNPDVYFGTEGEPKVSFFASDDSGEYEIILQGIGKNGEVLYAKKSITIGQAAGAN